MEKFKLFFVKNSTKIYKTQIFIFLFFIVIILLFNMDYEAHKYYNNSISIYNFHSLFSAVMIILFGVLFWISLFYPFIWLFQFALLIGYKIFDKKKILILIISILFYFILLVALFSLYSIEQHQRFIIRRYESIEKSK